MIIIEINVIRVDDQDIEHNEYARMKIVSTSGNADISEECKRAADKFFDEFTNSVQNS